MHVAGNGEGGHKFERQNNYRLAKLRQAQPKFQAQSALRGARSAAIKDHRKCRRRVVSSASNTIPPSWLTPMMKRDWLSSVTASSWSDRWQSKSGEHVLDIGTGTGRLAEFVPDLVGSNGRVIGIDPLAGRIEITRLRQSDNLQFHTGRAEDLSSFGDSQFDAVYLNSWITIRCGGCDGVVNVLVGLVQGVCRSVARPNGSSNAFVLSRKSVRLVEVRRAVCTDQANVRRTYPFREFCSRTLLRQARYRLFTFRQQNRCNPK